MDTASVKTQLAILTDGLLYMSESENKFDIIDAGPLSENTEIPAAFLDVCECMLSDFKTSDLTDFFSRQINNIDTADEPMVAQAKRYTALRDFLSVNLQAVKLLRAGNRQVHLFIFGSTEEGEIIGLHTVSIET